MNTFALALIKKFEGCRLTAYRDSGNLLTIGWGATGSWITDGMTISQDKADQLLQSRIAGFEKGVNNLVKVELPPECVGALICFSYNVGLGALQRSSLLKAINNNDPSASDHFLLYDEVHGKVIPGLLKRRQAEKALYDSGSGEPSTS